MRTLLNIIWFLFGGLPLFLGYLFAGLVACIFIVTIPAGVACFRIAGYVLWPFGKRVVDKPNAGAGSALMNIVWFLVAGLWLAIGHITTAAAQAVTDADGLSEFAPARYNRIFGDRIVLPEKKSFKGIIL